MKRVATVIRLRPEKEREYRRLHAAVWPDVLAALHRAHIGNYSIFLRDGLLFSYYEYTGDDLRSDLARLAEDETTQRWWQLTDPCQEPVASAADGEWWAPMEEVFHDDGPH
ncbi:L-rhamnose mutarotase [Streptomyces winkii]|uniref:L-rhamnose mutarotase n=1 Tax=Streptomyces winkii TaxID=3051178 RepID=UPI0028D80712|nr:L-rhamnose mutarotase [Streptomyces sp. DSM 40971]